MTKLKHILSVDQFDDEFINTIFHYAKKIEDNPNQYRNVAHDKIISNLFYEPSTRTSSSFYSAITKLGGSVIPINEMSYSSVSKGENLEDTIRTMSQYCDAIVLRHPEAGSVEKASLVTNIPIINAGDGSNQHPSQALLDLYTIKKEHGHLDNLKIVFIGDILHSRTLNSLVPLLAFYPGNTFHFVSPKELILNEIQRNEFKEKNIVFTEGEDLLSALPQADVIYMIRVQKERFADNATYEKVKDSYILKLEHLKLMKKEAIILHPLPRVNEIDYSIDKDKRAAYFRQAQNGLYIRMALLLYVFNL